MATAPNLPYLIFTDANGDPYTGAKLFTYATGTSTKITTYSDSAATSANTNPIILDSRGGATVYLTGGDAKFVLAPSTDTDPPASPILTLDPVSAALDSVSTDQWLLVAETPSFVSSTSFTVTGDLTGTYQTRRRYRAAQTAGTTYGTIALSSFAGGTTTVVVWPDSAGLDSGLSSVDVGLITATDTSAPPPTDYADSSARVNPFYNSSCWIWNEGTSRTSLANGDALAEGFKIIQSGAMVYSGDRSGVTPSPANAGQYVPNSILMTVTTADASIAATDFCAIQYNVEGYDWVALAQRPMALGFWVRASVDGTYCVAFRNSGSDRSYVAQYSINTVDTWEYKTILVPASPSAGTWDYTTGVGLRVSWALAVGSNFQTAAGSWVAGNFLGTSSQRNHPASTTRTFYLAAPMLAKGTVPQLWRPDRYDLDLRRSQRYYWKTFAIDTAPVQNVGSQAGAITYYTPVGGVVTTSVPVAYPVPMRSSPTVTTYNPQAANANWRNITAGADSGTSSLLGSSQRRVSLANTQVAGDAAGHALAVHATFNSRL